MKRFLYLQFKKVLKLFPFLLAVTLVLATVLGIVIGGIMAKSEQEKQTFNVAITGDRDNYYFKVGLSALQNLDETRFSVNIIDMDEKKAEKALQKGEISAYAVLPDNFIENALSGDVHPIKYVTTDGARDVSTLFKNEITTLITDMVIASQKGTYGLADAMYQNNIEGSVNGQMTNLTLRYVDLILNRTDMIEIQEIGAGNGLSIIQYYICGIFILFVMLIGIPFAPLYINKDNSLSRLLISKGYSSFVQLLCQYIAHLTALILLLAMAFLSLGLFGNRMGLSDGILGGNGLPETVLATLPVVIMFTSFNIMIFELSSSLVSGMLLHFFSTIVLCYISGCFYPIYAFPKAVQVISKYLPTGVAFDRLSLLFTGTSTFKSTVIVLAYAVLFFAIALIAKKIKTINYKGSVKVAKALQMDILA